MLSQTNNNFRILFLLRFTGELIKHSKGEIFELETALNEEKKELKDKIKETIKESEELRKTSFAKSPDVLMDEMKQDFGDRKKPFSNVTFPMKQAVPQKVMPMRRFPISLLNIPEPRLPPRLQYLRPIPTNIEVDIGKLNVLVKDPLVRTIQCNGPGENIIVQGSMGTKTTGIILLKDEVDDVIKKFSETSKIPVDEGVVRIVAGRLIFLAVISDVVSPKFLIKKMMRGPRLMG